MFSKTTDNVEKKIANTDGAKGAGLRWVLGPEDKMPNFYLRVVEVEPGGCTMHHEHPYEHQVFILEGTCELVGNDKSITMEKGDAGYVEPGEIHQFRNAGQGMMKMICCIPSDFDK